MVPSTISTWALPSYATAGPLTTCADVARWCAAPNHGQNPHPSTPDIACPDIDMAISTEVEAMVDVSPDMTPTCIWLDPFHPVGWPFNLMVEERPCAGIGITHDPYDVIRGKVCNLRFSMLLPEVDLGHTYCLYDDVYQDKYDELSPDLTECFGAWFFLVRQSSDTHYGQASTGEQRKTYTPGCP
jgi:hypothetical protein